jgi:hypothetical protein
MERSEIRGSLSTVPGLRFASLCPGYGRCTETGATIFRTARLLAFQVPA